MSCKDSAEDKNNALHKGEGKEADEITVTLEYSPYMPLISALTAAGISVQLKHDPQEKSREDHGYVRIFDGKGELIAEDSKFQHNSCFRQRDDKSKDLTEKVVAAVKA